MLAQTIVCRSFVGRKAELAMLHELRREASQGRGGLVLVSGEAGIGKTRLLAEFADSLASARVRVVASQCRQFAQRPYAPVLDAIGRIDPSAARIAPAASRDEQFEGTVAAYLAATKRGGVVALIEDIHWTDPATIELLATLGTAAESERLLLVLTYRPDTFAESDPMFAALGRLATVRNAKRIELRALSRAEVSELIDGALEGIADLSNATRKAVAKLSEGNPLFTEELLKNAVEREHASAERDVLPTTIRAAVLERLAPLQSAEREVLEHAAVIGREFDVKLLEVALDMPSKTIRSALQRARARQLIVEDRAGEFRFRHALTRETIYESFLDVQLRALHRRIADALERSPEAERSIQSLAYHCWAARDAERAIAFGIRAADEAMAVFAYEEAIRFFYYAAEFMPRDSAESAAIRRRIVRAFANNGENAESMRVAADTARILERLGDLEGECEVRIEWAVESYNLGLPDSSSPLTEIAARVQGPEHTQLRILLETTHAQLLALVGRDAEARAILEAIGRLPQSADATARISYLATSALLHLHAADIEEYLVDLEGMLRITTDENRPVLRVLTLCNAASVLTRVGRLEEASRYMHQAKALALENNYRGQLAIALACEAAQLYRSGDLAAASATLIESLEIGTDHEVARLQRAAYGTAVALLTGDTKLFERCYDEARLARHSQAGLIGFSYAEHMVASGRAAEARELLQRALPTVAGGDFAPFELPLAIARWGAQADVEEARAQLARLEDLPSRPLRSACLALFDAYMASRVGAPEAKSLGLAAAADFERLELPLWVADGLRLGGETERARALYARIGAVARLRDLERQAAVASPGETARDGGTLTAREREVAELVADGLSNGEIGAKLFITVKAVEKHLGSIYRKLDFSSRSKLIVYMKEH